MQAICAYSLTDPGSVSNAQLVEEVFEFCSEKTIEETAQVKIFKRYSQRAMKDFDEVEFNRVSRILEGHQSALIAWKFTCKEFTSHFETCFMTGFFCGDCIERAHRINKYRIDLSKN